MTDVPAFLVVLRRQQEKYRELAAAAEDQKKALGAGDMDALMGVVDRKRAIMHVVDQLEKAMAPTKARWSELRRSLDASSVREVDAAVEETRRILGDLLRLEDEARAELEKRRPAAAPMAARMARRAYGI